MSDTPTDAQIDSVLTGARSFLQSDDYQATYDLLEPLHAGGTLDGEDLGQVSFLLGEACLGLDGLDAAVYYYDEACRLAPSEQRQKARGRLDEIGRRDDAVDAEAEGVAGQGEAATVLRAAADALENDDYETARHFYQQAYDGIQMTRTQVSECAIGLAHCALHDGDTELAEGYLQIADPSAEGPKAAEIKGMRERIAQLDAGNAAAAGGVQRDEVDELYQAGRAAAMSDDWQGAYGYWNQAYESGLLPATRRGSFAYNMGVACCSTHAYDAAYGYFEEARNIGPPSTVGKANVWISRLAEMDEAVDTAYEIDAATEIDADLPTD